MDEFERKMRADVRIENIIQDFDEKRSIFWGTGTVTVFIIACSVADPECLSRIRTFSIPDPNLFHPGSA
jgi:hypothetical protein